MIGDFQKRIDLEASLLGIDRILINEISIDMYRNNDVVFIIKLMIFKEATFGIVDDKFQPLLPLILAENMVHYEPKYNEKYSPRQKNPIMEITRIDISCEITSEQLNQYLN